MKTRINIQKGLQSLEVDCDETNFRYGRYGSPIVLSKISNYFDSKCWSYEDHRLKSNLIPSKYLNDSYEHFPYFNDYTNEDQQIITSRLTNFTISSTEGLFYRRHDTVALDGDIPDDDQRRRDSLGNRYPKAACFSFKEAQRRLRESKLYWENFQGDGLDDESIRLPNKNKEPHSADFFLLLSVNKRFLSRHSNSI